MDFLFDFFYEVLSEEGIWVLILIGAALAVASFILLTMRLETSPRQRSARRAKSAKTPEEKNKNTGTVEDKNKKNGKWLKKRFLKRQDNEKKEAQNGKRKQRTEAEELEVAAEKDVEQDTIADQESNAGPIRPEMVSPDSFTKPEMEIPEQTPAETLEEPSLDTAKDLPETVKDSNMTQGKIIDPFAIEDIEDPGSLAPDKSVYDRSGLAQAEDGLGTEDTTTMASEDETSKDSEGESESEDEDEGEGSTDDNIFDLFDSVEDEESEVSELAKNLENVELDVFLNDTESLAKEIKDLFPKKS